MDKSGIPCWQCRKTVVVWTTTYIGVKLMNSAIYRRKSYPDNAGHWRYSVALEVLLCKVTARLRKEPTNTFGKNDTTSSLISESLGVCNQVRGCPERPQAIRRSLRLRICESDSRVSQLPRDVQGSSGPLLGVIQESESKRKRQSVNKGTREVRLSKAIARIGECQITKFLPMRQPDGGALVVVRDVNNVHMAKECRTVCY
jgi:hypothetical protein